MWVSSDNTKVVAILEKFGSHSAFHYLGINFLTTNMSRYTTLSSSPLWKWQMLRFSQQTFSRVKAQWQTNSVGIHTPAHTSTFNPVNQHRVEKFLRDDIQRIKTYSNLNIWNTVNRFFFFFGNINHDPISKDLLYIEKSNQMCLSPVPDGDDMYFLPTPLCCSLSHSAGSSPPCSWDSRVCISNSSQAIPYALFTHSRAVFAHLQRLRLDVKCCMQCPVKDLLKYYHSLLFSSNK